MLRAPILKICLCMLALAVAGVLHADDAQARFDHANALLAQGEAREAAREFQFLLNENPQFSQADTACYRMGETLQKAGEVTNSCAAFERLLRDWPRSEHVLAAHYRLARQLLAANPKAAAGHYEFVAAVTNNNALAEPAAFGRAEALYQAAAWPSAVAAYGRVLQNYPNGRYAAQALYSCGWAFFQNNDMTSAEKDFTDFSVKYPTNALATECRLKRVECLLHLKRYAEATQALDVLRQARPSEKITAEIATLSEAAAAGNVESHFASGDISAGVTAGDAFLKQYPDSARGAGIRFRMGEGLLRQGRTNEAVAVWEKLEACSATNVYAASALYQAALCCWKNGNMDRAGELFAAVAASHADLVLAVDAASMVGRMTAERIRMDLKTGKYDSALAKADAFLEVCSATNTVRSHVQLYRAEALLNTGRSQDALAAYRQCSADPAVTADATYGAGWAVLGLGRTNEARVAFEAFVTANPRHALAADAWFRLGEIAASSHDFASAATAYEAAASSNAAVRETALYKLGWMRTQLRQNAAAQAAFYKLLQDFPQSAYSDETHFQLGKLCQADGKWDAACAAFAAVTNNAWAGQAALQRAECLRAAGRNDAALAAYAAISTNGPDESCRVAATLGRATVLRTEGRFDDALAVYDEVLKSTGIEAARAMLGQGYCWLGLKKWHAAARSFRNVDVLYNFEELKPEALRMLVKTFEMSGETEQAAACRAELKKRFPEAVP